MSSSSQPRRRRAHGIVAAAALAVLLPLGTLPLGAGGMDQAGAQRPSSAHDDRTTSPSASSDSVRGKLVVGGPHVDRLVGTRRTDVIDGRGGRDRVLGRGGADELTGGPGNDRITGGPGADLVMPGSGRDVVLAGRGSDTVWLESDGRRDVVDCGPGRDRVRIIGRRDPRDRLHRCEVVRRYRTANNVAPTSERVPWEGGPAFYRKFPKAVDWTNRSFFPIGIWWSGISSDSEVRWDKSHGINTYVELNPATDFGLIARNGMYWIGDKLNSTFAQESRHWVGNFLGDEVDGNHSDNLAAGLAEIRSDVRSNAGSGRFNYANYTGIVAQSFVSPAIASGYVNAPDVVSLDDYFYTEPFCDWDVDLSSYYIEPLRRSTCRTASSYGSQVRALRRRDATDGRLKPVWMFVENYAPMAAPNPNVVIRPAQIKGAVMSSIINEARGIMYFNQSFQGSCQSGNVLRAAQVGGPRYCAAPQVAAMRTVNAQIRTLAPVLNTQSFRASLGSGLDTMLKARGGYAYVFAMVDGSHGPGRRTITLPRAVTGKDVRVLFEGRRLTASNGRITDRFPTESTYHIYRVHL